MISPEYEFSLWSSNFNSEICNPDYEFLFCYTSLIVASVLDILVECKPILSFTEAILQYIIHSLQVKILTLWVKKYP